MGRKVQTVEYSPLKSAHIELITKQNYEQPVFLNLMTNCHKGGHTTGCPKKDLLFYNTRLKLLNAKINRKHLGRHFLKDEYRDLRMQGIIKAENLRSNLHYHGRVDIGKWNFDEFQEFVEYQWKRLVPESEVKVLDEFDAKGVGCLLYTSPSPRDRG